MGITSSFSLLPRCEWTGLRFSPHGKFILLTTNGSVMRLLDAFDGHPMQTFAGHLNNRGVPIDGCFTPDSRFVISGSTDGRVHAWNAESGFKVGRLPFITKIEEGNSKAKVICTEETK